MSRSCPAQTKQWEMSYSHLYAVANGTGASMCTLGENRTMCPECVNRTANPLDKRKYHICRQCGGGDHLSSKCPFL